MASTASKFDSVNAELDGMLRRLLSELEVLRQGWVGRGGASFDQVKQQWARDQAALGRALGETATAIRNAGTYYSASDEEAASRVNATQATVRLPL